MAEQEPILEHPGTHEMGIHVKDYSRFIGMMKWGALACIIVGFIVVVFVL